MGETAQPKKHIEVKMAWRWEHNVVTLLQLNEKSFSTLFLRTLTKTQLWKRLPVQHQKKQRAIHCNSFCFLSRFIWTLPFLNHHKPLQCFKMSCAAWELVGGCTNNQKKLSLFFWALMFMHPDQTFWETTLLWQSVHFPAPTQGSLTQRDQSESLHFKKTTKTLNMCSLHFVDKKTGQKKSSISTTRCYFSVITVMQIKVPDVVSMSDSRWSAQFHDLFCTVITEYDSVLYCQWQKMVHTSERVVTLGAQLCFPGHPFSMGQGDEDEELRRQLSVKAALPQS